MEHRPIRFRVWDGVRMHEPDDYGCAFGITGAGEVFRTTNSRPGIELWEDCTALLSTGLRDADGREVFESDVMELRPYWMGEEDAGLLYLVHNDGTNFHPKPMAEDEWYLPDNYADSDDLAFMGRDCHKGDGNWRVVGHVYETTFAHLREAQPA